uniref:Uncharacterized protein n=1 Tax=Globodera rostochiensis TaxID=31243 RepID=A0A914H4R2_GLORO
MTASLLWCSNLPVSPTYPLPSPPASRSSFFQQSQHRIIALISPLLFLEWMRLRIDQLTKRVPWRGVGEKFKNLRKTERKTKSLHILNCISCDAFDPSTEDTKATVVSWNGQETIEIYLSFIGRQRSSVGRAPNRTLEDSGAFPGVVCWGP